MAGAPTPVQHTLLKRVEVHDSATRKSFESSSRSDELRLSIDAQQTRGASPVPLLQLVIHAGPRRLVPFTVTSSPQRGSNIFMILAFCSTLGPSRIPNCRQ